MTSEISAPILNSESHLQSICFIHLMLELDCSFTTYKDFTEWLGCYNYILPDERKVLPDLVIALAVQAKGDFSKLFKLHMTVEATLTQIQQKEILKWISDLHHSHTVLDSHFTLALASMNCIV